MEDDTKRLLRDLYIITNSFSISGSGISGSIEEGYLIDPSGFPPGPVEGPEVPESQQ